jgi:hypothetical protein
LRIVTHEGRTVRYAETPEDWTRAAEVVRAAGEAGIDTEFHGVNLRERSPCLTARVHVWSLAVANGGVHPRGYETSDGLVLPAAALFHPPIREVLSDPAIVLNAHNARSEYHSIHATAGLELPGLEDTLELYRWVVPGRLKYDLKTAAVEELGVRPLGSFKEVLSEPNVVAVERHRKVRRCECGAAPCRRRGVGHARYDDVLRWTEEVVRGERQVPLELVVEGHPKFEPLLVYAAEDAVFARNLKSLLLRRGRRLEVPTPFAKETP